MKNGSRSTRTSREVPYASYVQPSNRGIDDECILTFSTKLVKPTPAIAKLSKGDLLQLSLDSKTDIVALDKSGNVCGYIISAAYQKKMITCMQKGKDYEAEVLKITATACEVNVYGGK